jgi:Ca-activated chloride channel family protein
MNISRSLRVPTRRRRAWGIALGTLAAAVATMVLLPDPEAGADTPSDASAISGRPAAMAPIGAASSTPSGPTHVTLDGPNVHGVFALATGAVRADQASELLAELRLEGLSRSSDAHVPVSLAVVLDHSGSMSGEKMESARESILTLLGAMGDDDRLAVVVYDDEANLLQPLAPARVLRRSLADRVRRVTADGGTDIPRGLRLGIEALREAPAGHATRIILISDGRDGSGLSLSEVSAQVAQAAEAQVVTSSLGVGIDYDQSFMTAVADAGHGNYAFLEHGSMLAGFLSRELEESSRTVAENVIAEVTLPAHVRLVAAHGAIAHPVGDRVRVELGTLFAGARRKVVFELASDGAPLHATLPLNVRLAYHAVDPHGARAPSTLSGVASARSVGTDEEVQAAHDAEIYPDALATILDAQQDQAMTAWRHGDRESARTASVAALRRYRSAAAHHPSRVFDERISAVEAEMSAYDSVDPGSAAGRSFDLGTGASRREATVGF